MNIKRDINCNTFIEDSFEEGFVYIYILQFNNESQTYVKLKESSPIKFCLNGDGLYTLAKIKVPTDNSKPCYYYNTKFYYNDEVIDIEEMLSLNPEDTLINIEYYSFYQICNLKKCYVQAAKEVLDSVKRCSTNSLNSLIYKRDLLWSTLNVITYMAENEQYDEADELIKKVTECNGLCNTNKCNCRK